MSDVPFVGSLPAPFLPLFFLVLQFQLFLVLSPCFPIHQSCSSSDRRHPSRLFSLALQANYHLTTSMVLPYFSRILPLPLPRLFPLHDVTNVSAQTGTGAPAPAYSTLEPICCATSGVGSDCRKPRTALSGRSIYCLQTGCQLGNSRGQRLIVSYPSFIFEEYVAGLLYVGSSGLTLELWGLFHLWDCTGELSALILTASRTIEFAHQRDYSEKLETAGGDVDHVEVAV